MSNFGDLSWRNKTWGSADGRRIPIKDIKLGHLVNILNWVKDLPERYPQDTKDLLKQEADYRKFLGFTGKKPYPELIEGKWMMFDPKTGLTDIQAPPKRYLKKAMKNESYVKLKEHLDKIRSK